jgi:hypothetical protein
MDRHIEGVKTKNLRVIPYERGWLMEILRSDDDIIQPLSGRITHLDQCTPWGLPRFQGCWYPNRLFLKCANSSNYQEPDATNPINVYGRSKLLGEQNIMKHMQDYRIIRTSWLFGRHGKNFVDMLGLSGQMEQVKVVNDQFGKPTYTADLA